MDFVLDKDQVAELAAYLKHVALGRLRLPLGRKQVGLSLAAEHTPKRLLFRKLEVAGHERFRVVECGTEHGIDGGK
jgi:hypothetical protein